ncbi:MAG: SOS response-associated peptidase family protein, partial [Bradyrhizobium sp.]
MCGRFVITSPPAALRQIFGYVEQPNFPPRYNIAPTQPIPVVLLENGGRHFRLMRWGLVPAWVKDPRKFLLLIAIGGFSWLTMARVIRGQVMSLKNQPFVEAARAVGASRR